MVSIKIKTLFLICFMFSAYSEELRITDFRIPSSKVYKLHLSAELDKNYYSDFIEYGLDLMSVFRRLNDTTEFNILSRIGGGREGPLMDIWFYGSVGARHYLFSSPVFLHGELDCMTQFVHYLDAYESGWDNHTRGNFEIGTGVGHLRKGQYVALALYINDILIQEGVIESNLSEASILAIAETISKEDFFRIRYERYEKYLFQEIEKILILDPVCDEPIPVYVWVKILEAIRVMTRYTWSPRPNYWYRMFGTRFGVEFLARGISEHKVGTGRIKFPLFDAYYSPSVRFKFEYENPLDLRRQFSLVSFYAITWYDTASYYWLSTDLSYGYGIINFFLLESRLSLTYTHVAAQDTNSQHVFMISPATEFSYYIENSITISVYGGCDFKIEKVETQDRKHDFDANIFFDISTRWRIF